MSLRDDPLSEDIDALLGPDAESLSTEEQYRIIKEELEFSRFAPTTSPDALDSTKYNPAIQGYQDAGLSWGTNGWEPIDDVSPLRKFPEYVPTDAAIETLCTFGPLLEVGAGTGYWAHIVNENGGDCIPTDLDPRDIDAPEFPTTYTYDGSDEEYAVWAEVQEFDAVEAIREYPSRTVVMCHPDGATRWTESVLDEIEDQKFVFIGEWFPGMDTNPRFFKRLATEWTLVEEFPVYDWASMHAHGYVFTRD